MWKLWKKCEKMWKNEVLRDPLQMPGFWPIFWGPENLSKKSIFFVIFCEKTWKKGPSVSPIFWKKIFIFARGFWGVSRGCTSRFLECTKMIGIIWESVLRVPILLLLSDGFFGGPARGPEKKVFKKCSFFDSIFRGKNDTVFEVKKVVKKWVKNDPKNDPQNDPQNDPRKRSRGPLVNCLALSFWVIGIVMIHCNGTSCRYDCV